MRRIVFYLLFVLSSLSTLSQDSVWWARTTGKFPFMEYGIGDDRLGGAKLGYVLASGDGPGSVETTFAEVDRRLRFVVEVEA